MKTKIVNVDIKNNTFNLSIKDVKRYAEVYNEIDSFDFELEDNDSVFIDSSSPITPTIFKENLDKLSVKNIKIVKDIDKADKVLCYKNINDKSKVFNSFRLCHSINHYYFRSLSDEFKNQLLNFISKSFKEGETINIIGLQGLARLTYNKNYKYLNFKKIVLQLKSNSIKWKYSEYEMICNMIESNDKDNFKLAISLIHNSDIIANLPFIYNIYYKHLYKNPELFKTIRGGYIKSLFNGVEYLRGDALYVYTELMSNLLDYGFTDEEDFKILLEGLNVKMHFDCDKLLSSLTKLKQI